jgi:hypothetical protein
MRRRNRVDGQEPFLDAHCEALIASQAALLTHLDVSYPGSSVASSCSSLPKCSQHSTSAVILLWDLHGIRCRIPSECSGREVVLVHRHRRRCRRHLCISRADRWVRVILCKADHASSCRADWRTTERCACRAAVGVTLTCAIIQIIHAKT